jgi:uncharacterized protein
VELEDIGKASYIALRTYRKNGVGVDTPVWVSSDDGKLYVLTGGGSGKVKRISNDPRVAVCVSDMRGRPKGEWIDARARILDGADDVDGARRRLKRKYGLQARLFGLGDRRSGGAGGSVVVEISPAASADPA